MLGNSLSQVGQLNCVLYIAAPVFVTCINLGSAPSSVTPAPAPAPAASEGGLLVDVLGDFSTLAPPASQQSVQGLTPGAEEGFMKFLTKNNGVLFENNILQIGVKSDYKKNLGACIHNLLR